MFVVPIGKLYESLPVLATRKSSIRKMERIILSILFLTFIRAALMQDESQICKSLRTRILNEGDRFEPRPCFLCECRNRTLNCDRQEPAACLEPACDPALQVSTSDRCCKICPGVGTRCRFNGMSVEDGERFHLDPNEVCDCHNGNLTCSH